jgi:hypothetical protein
MRFAAAHESGSVKGCRPHWEGAACSAAGVRQPPKEETALGGRGMGPATRAYVAITPTNNLETIGGIVLRINARPHLYFQWFGRSKNDTVHNLEVNPSILLNRMGAN